MIIYAWSSLFKICSLSHISPWIIEHFKAIMWHTHGLLWPFFKYFKMNLQFWYFVLFENSITLHMSSIKIYDNMQINWMKLQIILFIANQNRGKWFTEIPLLFPIWFSVPTTNLEAIEGHKAVLYCPLTSPSKDKINMVLWFKDNAGIPLYRCVFVMLFKFQKTVNIYFQFLFSWEKFVRSTSFP